MSSEVIKEAITAGAKAITDVFKEKYGPIFLTALLGGGMFATYKLLTNEKAVSHLMMLWCTLRGISMEVVSPDIQFRIVARPRLRLPRQKDGTLELEAEATPLLG